MRLFFTFLLFVSSYSVCQTGLKVVSVFPANQYITSEVNTDIVILFDQPVNPLTITDTSLYIFGRWSGIAKGKISIDDKTLIFTPEKSFYPGELVFVNLSKKIKNSLGESLEFGYAWHFWIRTNKGTMDLIKLKEIEVREPGEGWIQAYGAYAGDLDKDGYTDFLVPNEVANDIRVFINDGKGDYIDFDIHQMPGGSRPSTNEGADFNLDGLMDIAVGNSTNKLVSVFLGDGTGDFTSVENYEADLEVRGLMTIDVNGDGFIDIVTANRQGNNVTVLLNDGDGTFSPSDTIETGGSGETTCSAADVNGDGIIDLFVGAISSREIFLLLGNGSGGFDLHNKISVTGNPWFTCAGDINGDNIADVVSANSSGNVLSVIFCDSLGSFSEPVYYSTGFYPLSADLGDVDGDGDLDVVTSNFNGKDFTLYENDGKGNMINRRNLNAVNAGSCSVFHDRDNDGDLDMTGVDEIADLLILFDNNKLTETSNETELPEKFYLYHNYPNPFNPETIISYQMPSAGHVSLIIYDILGNEIAELVNEEKSAGFYNVEFNAGKIELSSGIYLMQLKAGEFISTKKIVFVK